MHARRSRTARGPLLLPWLISAAIVLQCLPMTRLVAPRDTRVWKGYYMLLVRDGSPAAAALRHAIEGMGPGVVSEYTAQVTFTTFDSTGVCVQADLSGRLDSRDPRFDPYIREIGLYFRAASGGHQWRLAYIPADRSGFALFVRLTRDLGFPWRGEWRIVEFDLPERILVLAAALGMALALAGGVSEYRRESFVYCLAAAALWLPWLASAGMAELGLFFGAFFAWFSALQERIPFLRDFPSDPLGGTSLGRTLKSYSLAIAMCAAVYLPLSQAPLERLLGLLSVSLTPVVLLLIPVPRGGRRAVFRPVPIVSAGGGGASAGHAVSAYALASVLAVCLVTLLRSPVAPVPRRVTGNGRVDWSTLQSVRAVGVADPVRLPDMTDYVTHVAYQQSLLFGRPYSPPTAGERIYAREYGEDPARNLIVPRLRTVRVFDDAWLRWTTRRAGPSSIERMLLDQGTLVVVSAGSLRGTVTPDLLIGALVILVLLLRLRPLIRADVWRFNTARKDRAP